MVRLLIDLLRDERGTALIYVTVLLTVLGGVGVLAMDVGRLSTTHTQAQNAADAAALAGAQELDGRTDAISRATAAVAAVLNRQDFGDAPGTIAAPTATCADGTGTNCLRFLRSLPASDDTAIAPGDVTTDPAEARFIEVRLAPVGFTAMFAAVAGATEAADRTNQVGATAVAGNDPLICGIPPLVMCKPSDPTALDPGKMIKSFMQPSSGSTGSTASYVGGQFGLLCPADDATNCGAQAVGQNIASVTGTCVRGSDMAMKAGVNLQQVRAGLNARFDWWLPQASDGNGPWREQAAYVPARNVTQATEPQGNPLSSSTKCDRQDLDPAEAAALPQDNCIADGTCERFGDGDFSAGWGNYVDINHGGSESFLDPYRGQFRNGTSSPTRFEVYRAEIENTAIVQPGQTTAGGGTTTEDGAPQCFKDTTALSTPDYTYFDGAPKNDLRLLRDRRVLPVVVADCGAAGFDSKSFTPDDIIFVFLTEPMGDPAGSTIHVESLGPADGIAIKQMHRDVVQIYRR
ncbi:pilus assembly protein TadG-related protein [Caenispirillum salinarum]|uniref:pilus assembly protein TadG-related protein n=1 Tax=Caenispirillum salinarum TaxID=859058 RepID=UPI003850EF8B